MDKQVDSYRFISGITLRMVKTWVGMEKPRAIPWTPLKKELSDCTVATIVTAGMALRIARRRPLVLAKANLAFSLLPVIATPQLAHSSLVT